MLQDFPGRVEFEDVLDTSNTASGVWADSAYRSQEIEEKLAERGLTISAPMPFFSEEP